MLNIEQQIRVKWNGTISSTFSTSNGVKQGVVLSPILFNVYLDELIKMLSEQGLGCHFLCHLSALYISCMGKLTAFYMMLKMCPLTLKANY